MEINKKVRKTKRKFTMGTSDEKRVITILKITKILSVLGETVLDGVYERETGIRIAAFEP